MLMRQHGALERAVPADGQTDHRPDRAAMHVSMRARHGVTGVDPQAGFPVGNVGGPVEVSPLRIPVCPGVIRAGRRN
jgi:hypothetical protein